MQRARLHCEKKYYLVRHSLLCNSLISLKVFALHIVFYNYFTDTSVLFYGTTDFPATITLVTKHRTFFRSYMFKALVYPSIFSGVTKTLVINPNFIQTAVCLL